VAVPRAAAQKWGGTRAWNSKERTTLFVVRMMRSALPFCAEV